MAVIKKIGDPAAYRRNEYIASEFEQASADVDFLLLLNGVETISEEVTEDADTDED